MIAIIVIISILIVAMTGFTAFVVIDELLHERKLATESAPVESAVPSVEQKETPSATGETTHKDKYDALTDDTRKWYDEIAEYAASQNGAKCHIGKSYEEYAIGSKKIVRLLIKRGVTVCEFFFQNNDLKSYMSENNVAVTAAPTTLKVTNEATVKAAKNTIDIVVKNIEEEKEQKRKQANERRKQKRAQSEEGEVKTENAPVSENEPKNEAPQSSEPENEPKNENPQNSEPESSSVAADEMVDDTAVSGKDETKDETKTEEIKPPKYNPPRGEKKNFNKDRRRKTAIDFKVVK